MKKKTELRALDGRARCSDEGNHADGRRRGGDGAVLVGFFFSSRRRHTRLTCDWSSDVCSSDLESCPGAVAQIEPPHVAELIASIGILEGRIRRRSIVEGRDLHQPGRRRGSAYAG